MNLPRHSKRTVYLLYSSARSSKTAMLDACGVKLGGLDSVLEVLQQFYCKNRRAKKATPITKTIALIYVEKVALGTITMSF